MAESVASNPTTSEWQPLLLTQFALLDHQRRLAVTYVLSEYVVEGNRFDYGHVWYVHQTTANNFAISCLCGWGVEASSDRARLERAGQQHEREVRALDAERRAFAKDLALEVRSYIAGQYDRFVPTDQKYQADHPTWFYRAPEPEKPALQLYHCHRCQRRSPEVDGPFALCGNCQHDLLGARA